MMKVRKKLWVEPFPNRTFSDIIRHFKISFAIFRKFFWVVWWYRGYNYVSLLKVLAVGLTVNIESQKKSRHKSTDTEEVIKQMERCVFLIEKLVEDNYDTEFGYDSDFNIYFEPIEGTEYSKMCSDKTEAQKEHNAKVRVLAKEQKEKDKQECFDLIKNHYERWWH